MEDVGRDAAPQQRQDRAGAVAGIDAGAAELENLAGIGDKAGDIVFAGRVEPAAARRRLAPNQAIGAHHCLGAAAAGVVDHHEMVAAVVEQVAVEAQPLSAGQRPRSHRLVEDAVAQRLRGVDIGARFGKPHLQRPARDVDDAAG